MTRKDFALIASIIRAHQDGSETDHVVQGLALSLAIEFQKVNPRFDKARFIAASANNDILHASRGTE